MLETYRVIDLTDERGNLAAAHPRRPRRRRRARRAAGRLGRAPAWSVRRRRRRPRALADVLGLEPRQAQRRRRPRRRPTGQAVLAELCAGADVVFECGAVPVDLAALRAANPALVTVSITPFGSTGPKADWPATDLTVQAAGCQLAMTGDEDRAPVRTAVPQAFLHACADAAVGALGRPDRAGDERARPARRGLGPALDDAGDAELRARRAARRRRRRSGRAAASRPAGSTSSCCGRARTASCR